MSDSEPVSFEFIEDPYIPKLDDDIVTPSFDPPITFNSETECYSLDWNDEADLYLRNLTLDQIFYDCDSDYSSVLELQTEETELIVNKLANQSPSMSIAKRFRLKFFTKRSMRDVKFTFIDFSKPYLAKISNKENYKKFLNIGTSTRRANLPRMTKGKRT